MGDEPEVPPPPAAPAPEPEKSPPQYKKILIGVGVVIAVVLGFGYYQDRSNRPSESDLTAAVCQGTKESMQHTFDTDEHASKYHMTVTEVVAVKKGGGNEYEGMATITTPKSPSGHRVSVQITADPNGALIWKTEPGAFFFLAQEGFPASTNAPSWGGPVS